MPGRPAAAGRPSSTVCRDDERLAFELLVDITATDPAADDENLWVGVQLLSIEHKHRLAIKCLLPKATRSMPSSVPVLPRRAVARARVRRDVRHHLHRHPDPRNILLPDDWVGYPLRKDYEFPKEYHGISCE